MNKILTCLALLLIADALSIKQTIEFRDLMANSSIAILVTLEGAFRRCDGRFGRIASSKAVRTAEETGH